MSIMAIDPGRDKCGLVVMNVDEIQFQRVIETVNLELVVLTLVNEFKLQTIVMGNGTTSNAAKKRILAVLPDIQIEIIDEHHTTELARKLYWQKNPPTGWRRLLPTSMQVPPAPVDDIVAEILARRFLER